MRVAFAGTPPFAERALARLADSPHQVVLVLTQPDRPAGRGMHLGQSAVKTFALARGYDVFQPSSLGGAEVLDRFAAVRADVLVVAAYGLLVPGPLLATPPHGAINIHASLLPRWRGAAPVQRALLAGDTETGVSIMQMDEGLDTGPVLAAEALAISPDDDAGSLETRLAETGARRLLQVLAMIEQGGAHPVAQPRSGITYARKVEKSETRVRWERPALELERTIRAFRPAPGAAADVAGVPTKLWRAHVLDATGVPGTVLSAGDTLAVACGAQALAIEELQPAGGRRMPAAQFLRGRPLAIGARLA